MSAPMDLTDAFKQISEVVIDAFFITDAEGRILDYNRAFFRLFPRQVARELRSMAVGDALPMERDVAAECMAAGRHVRLDEIPVRPLGSDAPRRVILSAIPLARPDGGLGGALVILRDVTDEALIQAKYQALLETEAAERERLAERVRERTSALVEANELLLELQRELMEYKKGLRF